MPNDFIDFRNSERNIIKLLLIAKVLFSASNFLNTL